MEDAKVKNVVMSVTQTANYSGTFELLIAGSNPAIAFSGLDLPVFGNRSSHVCDIHSKTITVRTCQTRCGINDFIVARTAINLVKGFPQMGSWWFKSTILRVMEMGELWGLQRR